MAFLFAIIAILTLSIGFFAPKEGSGSEALNHARRGLKFAGCIFAVLSVLSASFVTVPAGTRGVLLQFGAVAGKLDEGAHFILPMVQRIELMEVRTQKEEAKASAASKDLQTVAANIAINYHVDPMTVGNLYKTVGLEYASRIIDPATQETVKAVVANYTAEELVRLRTSVKAQIDIGLTERLAKYNIIVEPGGVSLTNFDFSDEFNKAIERKQVAQQTAEQQKYELQRAELEAKTNVATAKGKAEAARIEAQALSTEGGQKVLTKLFLEKWDGKLPLIAGANSGMIIDLKSLMETAKQPQ